MAILVRDLPMLSANGIHRIHCRIWQPEPSAGRPRAMLQIIHGKAEHVGRYGRFAEEMVRQGFVVFGEDHLGHGRSVANAGEFGDTGPGDASFHIIRDIHNLRGEMEAAWPELPLFMLGHSMGSFLLRRYLMEYGEGLAGAIIMGTGEPDRLALAGGSLLLQLMRLIHSDHYDSALLDRLTCGNYNRRIERPRTPSDWLSSDPAEVDAFRSDPLTGHRFRLNAYDMLFTTLRFIQRPANIERIPKHLPLLLVAGRQDPVGDYGAGVRQVWEIYRTAGLRSMTLKFYPDARHELLNEYCRDEVIGDILRWCDGQPLADSETTLDLPRGTRRA